MNGRIENDMKIFKIIESQLYELPSFISDWYFNLKANKQTAMTCRDYINKIKLFLSFINPNYSKVKLSDFNELIITKYFIKIQEKEENKNGNIVVTETSDSYRQAVWSCLNNFFTFLYDREMIPINYFVKSKIKRPKKKTNRNIENKKVLLTQDDFNKILHAIDTGVGSNKAKGYQHRYKNRDKAIMLIFMTTGMRKTALTEINVEDIDIDKHKLSVIDKGHIIHEYYLNDVVIDVLKKWLLDRFFLCGNESGALFVSKDRTRMTGTSIDKLVDKYAKEGLGKHISPHKLRGGFISILYQQTGDIEFVREVVGHSKITTTQNYITTNGKEKEKAAGIMNNLLNTSQF